MKFDILTNSPILVIPSGGQVITGLVGGLAPS